MPFGCDHPACAHAWYLQTLGSRSHNEYVGFFNIIYGLKDSYGLRIAIELIRLVEDDGSWLIQEFRWTEVTAN